MATAKKSPGKDLALFGDKSAALPAHLHREPDAPTLGNETVGTEDLAIPRLSVLQALSPQIEDVEGAKPGLLHVSVTNDLLESVYCVNLAYIREFTVFKKRNAGGGFFGSFPSQAEANAAVELLDGSPDQYDITETAKHTLLLLDSEGNPTQPVQTFMSGTKLSVSREWNSQIQLRGPNADRFASVWELSAVQQQNKRGDRYYNLRVEFCGWAPEATYNEAKRTFYRVTGRVEPQAALEAPAA